MIQVQSDDEGEGSPKAKKAKSADGDEGGGGDNFIDDEVCPKLTARLRIKSQN